MLAGGGVTKIEFFNVGTGGIPTNPNTLFSAEPFFDENLIPLKPLQANNNQSLTQTNKPVGNTSSRKNYFTPNLACQ
ncbi:MAG: hypothetical protein AAFQ91_14875 [Cyanobacteria bacterium J06621_15]